MKGYKNRISLSFIGTGTIFSQGLTLLDYIEAASVDLLITGTGVNEEVAITEDDWSKYEMVERHYSRNNSFYFHKIVKVKGYDLFDLNRRRITLKTDKDYEVNLLVLMDLNLLRL